METMTCNRNHSSKIIKEDSDERQDTEGEDYSDDDDDEDSGEQSSKSSPYMFGEHQPHIVSWILFLELKVLGIAMIVIAVRRFDD